MKNIVVLFAFSTFILTPLTFAQKGEAKTEMRKENKINQLEELDLSEDQLEKMESLQKNCQATI